MRKKALLLAIMLLVGIYFTIAAPTAADVDEAPQETAAEPGAAGTVATEGGNITEVNITGEQITTRWTGFYGEVSGNVSLEDANSAVFYYWSVSNVTDAVVYASNETVSTWTLSPAEETDMPTNLQADAADNYASTFEDNETFTSASLSVENVTYANTWSDGSAGNLKTYALKDADNALIFAGKAIADETSFKGGAHTVDYQILAAGYDSGVTYNFYLELP